MEKLRLGGVNPKIGIRPIIDGRRGGIRESLEEMSSRIVLVDFALQQRKGSGVCDCRYHYRWCGRGCTCRREVQEKRCRCNFISYAVLVLWL